MVAAFLVVAEQPTFVNNGERVGPGGVHHEADVLGAEAIDPT